MEKSGEWRRAEKSGEWRRAESGEERRRVESGDKENVKLKFDRSKNTSKIILVEIKISKIKNHGY